MYIDYLRLENVKCFEDIELKFQTAQGTDDLQSNWNVILGNNGDGKTTLLQAIAACLMDTTTAERLLKPDNWVRNNNSFARFTAYIFQESIDKQDGRPPEKAYVDRRTAQHLIVAAGETIELAHNGLHQRQFFATATMLEPTPDYHDLFWDEYDTLFDDIEFLKRNAFRRQTKRGWFSCGYGAFRRISGFSTQVALVDDQLQKRFLTLFEEGAALYDCESWLKELQRKATKSRKGSIPRHTMAEVKTLLPQLLPDITDITITDELLFDWRDGHQINLNQLSDGYRSMFALGVDILRWLELMRPKGVDNLRDMSGIVLIDEIDAHLHPKWQRQAGFLLTKVFPNIQFIVATHSPFVAMAAGEKALTLLEKEGDVVSASQDVAYSRGWAVDQVLIELFGLVSLRDPETAQKLERYDALRLAQPQNQLSDGELKELQALETELNKRLAFDSDSPHQRKMDDDLAYFTTLLKQQKGAPHA